MRGKEDRRPPGPANTIDLRESSDLNFRRHRVWRIASASAGLVLIAVFVGLGVQGLYEATPLLSLPARLVDLAIFVLLGYLCFSVLWIPYKFWGQPPVAIRIDSSGMSLLGPDGEQTRLGWRDSPMRLELLVRSGPSVEAKHAAYRLLITRGAGDYTRAWRGIVPVTYLTREAAGEILAQARVLNLPIHRLDQGKRLSLLKANAQSVFVISNA